MRILIALISILSISFIGCETNLKNKSIYIKNTNIVKTNNNLLNLKKDKTIVIKESIEVDKKLAKVLKQEDIKIGLLLPLKGKNYRIGKSLLNAVHLALSQVDNQRIKIYVKDSSEVGSVTKSYYELLDRNVNIIIGPIFSDKVSELRSIAEESEIPILTFSNNIEIISDNIFAGGLMLENEIETILDFVLKEKYTNIAIIAPENSYGKRIIKKSEDYLSLKDTNINKKVLFDEKNPDFYEIAKNISNYDLRKNALKVEIERLKAVNTFESNQEIKLLKRKDTLGKLEFEGLLIAVESFQQLSLLSSILPYYDVDQKEVQYLGTSIWNKDTIIKEPGLENSVFVSLNKNKVQVFNTLYKNSFNKNPHPIAIYAFDTIGLISSLNKNNLLINKENILSLDGFNGLSGKFKFKKNGEVSRSLMLYRIQNEKIINVNN